MHAQHPVAAAQCPAAPAQAPWNAAAASAPPSPTLDEHSRCHASPHIGHAEAPQAPQQQHRLTKLPPSLMAQSAWASASQKARKRLGHSGTCGRSSPAALRAPGAQLDGARPVCGSERRGGRRGRRAGKVTSRPSPMSESLALAQELARRGERVAEAECTLRGAPSLPLPPLPALQLPSGTQPRPGSPHRRSTPPRGRTCGG